MIPGLFVFAGWFVGPWWPPVWAPANTGTPEPPVTHNFIVNDAGAYSPSSITAEVGDPIQWKSLNRRDTVIRVGEIGTGVDPCTLSATYGAITDEFTGPIRRGVAGIWVKGPPNAGVGSTVIADSGTCSQEPAPTVGGFKYCGSEAGQLQSMPSQYWAKEGIQGEFASLNWSILEKNFDGDYDWSVPDAIADLAADNGKSVIFSFSTAGDATPSWLSGTSCSVVSVEGTNDNDPGTANCGASYDVINIADADCITQMNDLFDAYHAHLILDSARFAAVVGFNAPGMSTLTDEIKTFYSCPDEYLNSGNGHTTHTSDGILDKYEGDECTCNTAQWAAAGYTTAKRDTWFTSIVSHVHGLAGWETIPFRFMMLDAGFPRVESSTNFDGDSLCTADTTGTCDAAHMLCTGGACGATPAIAAQNDGSIKGPSPQLDALSAVLLAAYGDGMEFGNAGLDLLPQEQVAPQNCAYATQQFDPLWFLQPSGVYNAHLLLERGHISVNGYQGCPNGRAVNVGFDGYRTVWQPHNVGQLGDDTVGGQESVILNMLGNTRGDRIELYAASLFDILFDPAIGTSLPIDPTRTTLGCPAGTATAAGLAPCDVAPFSKSVEDYTDEMVERRGQFDGDPFPNVLTHVFTVPGTYYFYNARTCADGVGKSGRVVVMPP